MKTLQKFTSLHGVIYNHFNHERHLTSRNVYKRNRSAAMAVWGVFVA
jgi:putative transposase